MKNTYIFKQVSSLAKVFPDDDITRFEELNKLSALKGERLSYQIIYKCDSEKRWLGATATAVTDERIPVEIKRVGCVPSMFPCLNRECDEWYLRKNPGMFPDVLYEMPDGKFDIIRENYHSLLITAFIPEDIEAGVYPVNIKIQVGEDVMDNVFEIKVLDEKLSEKKVNFTQWFHGDCIATYYKYDILSEEHWAMMDKFIEKAAHIGINMILTPMFTLPLDTEVGLERPTLQLVDVYRKNGEYSFGFDKMKRWIDICKKHGMEFFEMSHLFSQWGTGFAPKIVAETENGTEKIFGWHTKALSDEYQEFLNNFIPALTDFLKAEGIFDKTYFHISDEPNYEKHHEIYTAERKMLSGLIPDDRFFEACSDYRWYEEGTVSKPFAITCKVDEFYEHGHKDIWAYYCCGPCDRGYGNRLFGMPAGRNRINGMQLYKYDIDGFLHWGYNFYYTELSRKAINPFFDTDASEGFQSGDSYSVYPGEDGPLDSMRSVVFYESLQDYRACRTLEKYIGKDEVDKILNSEGELKFNEFPRTDEGVLALRNKIYDRLEKEL